MSTSEEVPAEIGAQLGARRRTWEEMDALRARMVHEGYALADLDDRERERVWRSLAGHTRRHELQALLRMNDGQVEVAVARVRAQRLLATGRR